MRQSELQQFAFRNRIFITGRLCDVTEYLKTLSDRYKTVKEYLDELTRAMD